MKLSEEKWGLGACSSGGFIVVLGSKDDLNFSTTQRIQVVNTEKARLVAKAPELLKHLEDLLPFLENFEDGKKYFEVIETLSQIHP